MERSRWQLTQPKNSTEKGTMAGLGKMKLLLTIAIITAGIAFTLLWAIGAGITQ